MFNQMRKCTQAGCNCTTRHYRTQINEEGSKMEAAAWRCGNCGHITPVKKQGQASAGVFAALVQQLEFKNEGAFPRYTGYITFDQLLEVMKHHSLRRFSVSAAGFGQVDMDTHARKRWLDDDYRVKKAARLAEKTGRPVEASITLYVNKKESGFTHDVSVFGIYAFTNDERKEYYPYD